MGVAESPHRRADRSASTMDATPIWIGSRSVPRPRRKRWISSQTASPNSMSPMMSVQPARLE